MTASEIKAIIAAKIAGQGTAIDASSVLPTILNGIIDLVVAAQGDVDSLETTVGTLENSVTSLTTEVANKINIVEVDEYETFDAEKDGGYAIDDIVRYDGKLWKFTAAHEGEWDEADVEQTNIVDILS